MTLTELCEKRKHKTFTLVETLYLLEKNGYKFRWVETDIPKDNINKKDPNWEKICWKHGTQKQKSKELCERLKQMLVPEHFAYIKFYTRKDRHNEEEMWALVAGKSQRINTGTDLCFWTLTETGYKKNFECNENSNGEANKIYRLADVSKKMLYHSGFEWYSEKILVFWNPKAENKADDNEVKSLAFAAEKDICGLLGLFSS